MPEFLADTNIVFRWVTPTDSQHALCVAAVEALYDAGHTLYIAPQILTEFWALSTRPIEANGLGQSVQATRTTVQVIRETFVLLPEIPEIYPTWLALAEQYSVIGRQVYDTRLVAVMQVYGISHILILNETHFRRFTEITVASPEEVINQPSL